MPCMPSSKGMSSPEVPHLDELIVVGLELDGVIWLRKRQRDQVYRHNSSGTYGEDPLWFSNYVPS
jgi:hypothetical protein